MSRNENGCEDRVKPGVVMPTMREEEWGGLTRQIFKHDAFGVVILTHTQNGGDTTLFGSDIGHMNTVRVRVARAQKHRNLSCDQIYAENSPLVEFEMSSAQWSEFVSSVGKGGGTPVTLRYCQPRDAERISEMPKIKSIESKHETFKREIKKVASERLQNAAKAIKRLENLIESGKLGKRELREIQQDLALQVNYLPGSLEFVVEQAEDALEKATSDAKIEVEAFVHSTAVRLGLQSIEQLGTMGNEVPTSGGDTLQIPTGSEHDTD